MNKHTSFIDIFKIALAPFFIGGLIWILFQGLWYSIDNRDPSTNDKLLLLAFITGLLILGYLITKWIYDLTRYIIVQIGTNSKKTEFINAEGNDGVVEFVNKNSLGYKFVSNVDYITECNEHVKDSNLQMNQLIFIRKYNYVTNLTDIIDVLDRREEKLIRKREKYDRKKYIDNKEVINESKKNKLESIKCKIKDLQTERKYYKTLINTINRLRTLEELDTITDEYKRVKFKYDVLFNRVKSEYINQSDLLSFTNESIDLNKMLTGSRLYVWYMNYGRIFLFPVIFGIFYLFWEFTKESFVDKTMQQGINVILTTIGFSTLFTIGWSFSGRFKIKYLTPTDDLALFYNLYMNSLTMVEPIEENEIVKDITKID